MRLRLTFPVGFPFPFSSLAQKPRPKHTKKKNLMRLTRKKRKETSQMTSSV
jgi:hypothetical protein